MKTSIFLIEEEIGRGLVFKIFLNLSIKLIKLKG